MKDLGLALFYHGGLWSNNPPCGMCPNIFLPNPPSHFIPSCFLLPRTRLIPCSHCSFSAAFAKLLELGVPESQWPERLREKASKAAKVERPIDISRNAFEEMDRSLAAKRAVSNPGSQ